jgi:hypothetical protein
MRFHFGKERGDRIVAPLDSADAPTGPAWIEEYGPIDGPAPKPDPLGNLVWAAASATISKAIEAHDYDTIIQALGGKSSADELNNLGCAWALLAQREGRLRYWQRAIDALTRAAEPAADEQQAKRRAANAEHVQAAAPVAE